MNSKWMIDWVSNLECVSEFRGDHPSFGVGKYKLLSEAKKFKPVKRKFQLVKRKVEQSGHSKRLKLFQSVPQ